MFIWKALALQDCSGGLHRQAGKKVESTSISGSTRTGLSQNRNENQTCPRSEKGFLKTKPEYLSFCRLSLSRLISLPSPSSSPLFTPLYSHQKTSELLSFYLFSYYFSVLYSLPNRQFSLALILLVSCNVAGPE